MNAGELFRYFGTIGLNTKEAEDGLDKVSNKARKTADDIDETGQKSDKTGGRLGKLGGVCATVGAGVSALGQGMITAGAKANALGTALTHKITVPAGLAATAMGGIVLFKGWNRLTEIDNAKGKLQALGYTGDEVSGVMQDALAAVRGTAYSLDQAATAAASALAAGIQPGQKLTRYLSICTDAAAVANVEFNDMGAIFNKVQGAGRAYTMELNQLADKGLPIYQWLADANGTTIEGVRELASSGKISSEMFLEAIEKNIGGAAVIMGSTTITGAIRNLWASVGRIGENFLNGAKDGQGFFDQVKPLLANLAGVLDGVEKKASVVGAAFGRVFSYAVENFGALIPLFKPAGDGTQILTDKMASLEEKAKAAVDFIVGGIRTLKEKFDALPESAQGIISKLPLIAIVAGPVLRLLGTGISGAGRMFTLLGTVITKVGAILSSERVAVMAHTIAVKANALAHSSAVTRILAFAAAHKAAALAALGVVGVLIALGVGLAKSGGDADALANNITQMTDKIVTGINSFMAKLPEMIPKFVEAIISMIDAVVGVLPVLIPQLVGAAIQLFMALVQAIPQIIPPLVAALPLLITALVGALVSALPVLIQGALQLFMALVQAIPQIIPPLVAALPLIINAVIQGLLSALPALISGAVQLFMALVLAIPQIITALAAALPQIINSLVTFLTDPSTILMLFEAMILLGGALIEAIPEILKSLLTAMGSIVEGIGSLLSGAWEGIKSIASSVWGKIKTAVTSPIETAKSVIKTVVDTISSTVSGVFTGIKTTATTVWEGIKSAITTPIKEARDKVKSIIDKIKGFFEGLSLKLPHIKLPHFNIEGKLSLAPPSIPKLKIDWYKEGGIMAAPTIFGATGDSLLGGGEAGREAILPLNRDTLGSIGEGISATMTGDTEAVESKLDAVITAINELGELLGGLRIYLDTGTLVGGVKSKMDDALGKVSAARERGLTT